MYYQEAGEAYVPAKTEEHPPHIPTEHAFLIHHSRTMSSNTALLSANDIPGASEDAGDSEMKMLGSPLLVTPGIPCREGWWSRADSWTSQWKLILLNLMKFLITFFFF